MNTSKKHLLHQAAIHLAGDLRQESLKYGITDQKHFIDCLLGLGRGLRSVIVSDREALRIHYCNASARLPEIRALHAFAAEKPRLEGQGACLMASNGDPLRFVDPSLKMVLSAALATGASAQETLYMVAVVIALTVLPDDDISERLITEKLAV
jgi:hypothetical protein